MAAQLAALLALLLAASAAADAGWTPSTRLKADDDDDATQARKAQAKASSLRLAAPPALSAAGCLSWVAAPTSWRPGHQGAATEGICRFVETANTPPIVSIGKVEGPTCFYTATNVSDMGGLEDSSHLYNGSAHSGAQFAAVTTGCNVSFVDYTQHDAFPSNAVLAGFDAAGSRIGVCLVPNGEGAGSHLPGSAYLSGPRQGQCCCNAGYRELCTADETFPLAVFTPPALRRIDTAAARDVGVAKLPEAVHNASASSCILWTTVGASGSKLSWAPGVQGKPSGFCRQVSLDSTPMGTNIGKTNGHDCYFTANVPGVMQPNSSPRRNGTSLAGFEIATVSPLCVVNFTVVPAAREDSDWPLQAVANDTVVAGFQSDASSLGLCLVPDGEGQGSKIPGQAYLSGPRQGQCCFSSGFRERCTSGGFFLAHWKPTPPPPPPKVQHFVVLFMNDQTFDKGLGCMGLPGADGISPSSGRVLPKDPDDPAAGTVTVKCGEASPNVPNHWPIGGGGYDAFSAKFKTGADMSTFPYAAQNDSYSYENMAKLAALEMLAPADLPVAAALAKNFGAFNKLYNSVPGSAAANVMFALSGTSCGMARETVGFDQCGGDAPAFPQATIFDQMALEPVAGCNKTSFGLFYNKTATDSARPWSAWPEMPMASLTRVKDRISSFDDFFAKAGSGSLPSVSMLTTIGAAPRGAGTSMTAADGEAVQKQIYEALRAGPGWNETLLFIVHIGENETFYDEAVPPYEDVPADESSCTQRPGCSSGAFDFRRLGLRTTGLLISPWIPSGTVIQRPRQGRYNSSQFELTSILSTTRELFGSEENYLLGPLTQRDAWSASFAELLTLDEPRVDAPVRLPG